MINLSKIIKGILAYKFLIVTLIAILVIGVGLYEGRLYLIDKTQVAKIDNTSGYVLGDSASDISPSEVPPSDTPTPQNNNVLGTSTNSINNNSGGGDTLLTVTPFPTKIPNPTPYPTLAPLPTIVPNLSTPTPTPTPTPTTSPHSCAGLGASPGQPVFYYSETSSPQSVSDTGTISIDLRDCNNNSAPVSDTLTISQQSGPNTSINGDNTPPVSIESSGGKASFIVSSPVSGTAVYLVTDTTHSFNVTDPNNHNPQVTFTVSSPASTPTPTMSPTPSPTGGITITPSLTVSPSPSVTITLTPTPTIN